jgi:nitrate reductase NapAB chaperone NapD
MTTEQLTEKVIDLEQKISAYDERSRAAIARLDTVEREVKDQGKLLVVVERLANGISNLTSKVDHLDAKVSLFGERISLIELKPAKNMEKIKMIVWSAVITGTLTFLLTYILRTGG